MGQHLPLCAQLGATGSRQDEISSKRTSSGGNGWGAACRSVGWADFSVVAEAVRLVSAPLWANPSGYPRRIWAPPSHHYCPAPLGTRLPIYWLCYARPAF
jgi:hypothetical protein